MGIGSEVGVVPLGARSVFTRTHLLHETDQTRVWRVWKAGRAGSLILKEHCGPDSVERQLRELRVLTRLVGVPGVTQLASGRGVDELLFDDASGVTLAEQIVSGRSEPSECAAVALELARTLGVVHDLGVVHKDINPSNILVTAVGARLSRPLLIDFHLATTHVEGVPGFVHQRELVGTLPYLAPEQTGRTGMSVDERADLYSLGATVYELVSGRPPFPLGDPLEMIHDALVRVAVPLVEVVGGLSRQFSDIVVRLLEKEPDRRYQSAHGLVHDLSRLVVDLGEGRDELFPVGGRDFPRRLSAPSRLIGRDRESAALRAAFDTAVSGGRRGILVAGRPGVGKTALVDGLRSVVTAQGGWFVTGKFDQYRTDVESGGTFQALRGLGRLLLAGTPGEVGSARERIVRALGPNLDVLSGLPEFATLVGQTPGASPIPTRPGADDLMDATRQMQAAVDLLGAIASPEQPVVIFIDDLQWASAGSIRYLEMVLRDQRLRGVLLVGAYRIDEIGPTHPLTTALSRWRLLDEAPAVLALEDLPAADLGEMLGEMLRLPTQEIAGLASAIGARSGGNPFDSVELVNALRRDGALVCGVSGWSWDAATIRRFIGTGDVLELVATRVGRLPLESRQLLDVMACLGGEFGSDLLCAAAALSAAELAERLVAPMEDGLVLVEVGHGASSAVRFRHDRVQQAVLSRLTPSYRRDLGLAIARRLATLPAYSSIAADQYFNSVDVLHDPDERRHAAALFVTTAAALKVQDPPTADRLLNAAIALLTPTDTALLAPTDTAVPAPTDLPGPGGPDELLARARRQSHAVLYGLGRLADADAVYELVRHSQADPVDLVPSGCVQIASLFNRGRTAESAAIGLGLLAGLGITVPEGGLITEVGADYDEVSRWAAGQIAQDDPRPDTEIARVRMAATVLTWLMGPALFSEPPFSAWLFVTGQRLWADYGPCAPLVATLSGAMLSTIPERDDYRTGYAVTKMVLAVGEARGYEPETSFARHLFNATAQHWFEPLEDGVQEAHRAREGLIHGGDLQSACLSFLSSIPALLDCSPTVESFADEVQAALDFAARTGNEFATVCFLVYQQLLRALRGETAGPGSFNGADFDEAGHLGDPRSNPNTDAHFHIYRGVAAAIFADGPSVVAHADAALPTLPHIIALYPVPLAHLLHGLGLAERARAAEPDRREALLVELDREIEWLRTRAGDAPANFAHLTTLLVAERAWATADVVGAIHAFDTARRQSATRSRPWHRALITERAARFHLAHALISTGRDLLTQARSYYAAWGATGKVAQLEEEYRFLRETRADAPALGPGRNEAMPGSARSGDVSGDRVDMLAVLRASQALSSATSLDQLRARVGDVLKAMTGASTVLIALRGSGSEDWLLFDTLGGPAPGIPLEDAAALVAISALRYAERTAEPLLVEDAAHDDRFARDPYLAAMARCSLLLVPIQAHGVIRAVLVLENRHRTGAFTADRLGVVTLIAGQLSVSLDNAQLYASLEQKVAERTAALNDANARLEVLSTTDALTQLPNRRHFDATLQAEWRRAIRQGTSLGVAMIDVDNFKGFNDEYGHLAGDECLRLIAGVFQSAVREESDVVCRYGGEEFAAILPGTDETAIMTVAERIRSEVAALCHRHSSNEAGIVTVSVGVSALKPDTTTKVQELIASADAGLYEAKKLGRNRVCSVQGR